MHPGNAAIVQYNAPGEGVGHYVSLWQQRNDRKELWYFYYNSIGVVKLFAGRSIAELTENIASSALRTSPRMFRGDYKRTLFILNLPEGIQERKNAVLDGIKNINNSNRIVQKYLKLNEFSTIAFPHNFFTALLHGDQR